MQLLQKITTQYIESEDRIRVSGELAAGQQVVLWFSQRLMVRLLPALLQWLEKQVDVDVRPELYQTLAQAAAVRAMEPQAPVEAEPASQSWLVQAVDITPVESALLLVFRSAATDQHSTALQLQARPLRQWLNGLVEQFQKAQWPLTAWPQWLLESRQSPSGLKATTILH
jgi:hypothetical protein